ncbi:MAG: DUF2551 domain-containing protein [Methanoregulaceae archaeon]|nr:DUF2551 domain-containing protein [Methanoregulaceae archaeon]
MRSPAEIKKLIETRLKSYLSRDRTGIRRETLRLFLKVKSLTVADIFERLQTRFSISYHSVAAMVGIIASRLGILHVTRNRENTCSTYQLKEQYTDIVARIVGI